MEQVATQQTPREAKLYEMVLTLGVGRASLKEAVEIIRRSVPDQTTLSAADEKLSGISSILEDLLKETSQYESLQ